MSRGIYPSSSHFESGPSRIGASVRNRPMRGAVPHPSRSSLGNEDSTLLAPKYRVSDQDGMISIAMAAGMHGWLHGSVKNPGKLSPHTGMNSHGTRSSGQAEMSGQHGTTAHGPAHLRLPQEDGHGCLEA